MLGHPGEESWAACYCLLVLLGMVLADQAAEWLLTKRAQAKNVTSSHLVNERKDQQNPNVQSAS
jgi:hypothetical protein